MDPRFLSRVNRMVEAFGDRKFPTAVLERIELRTLDLNEAEFRLLTDLVIDNCQHAPTVAKIIEYANIVRGKRGTAEKGPESPLVHRCEACLDVGLVKVVAPTGADTLGRCVCDEGVRHWAKIPSIDEVPASSVGKINPAWFKPKQPQGRFSFKAMEHKRDEWKARVEMAEMYWEHERQLRTP